MGLVSDIQTIVTGLYPDSNYKLLSEFSANEEAFFIEPDKVLIVFNNNIRKNSEIKQNNNVIKDTSIKLFVLKQDTDDNTDLESEQLRADCEIIADRIAVNIYQTLEVRPSGNQKYIIDPEFNAFASDFTGVTLQMDVNYNEIVNFNKPE